VTAAKILEICHHTGSVRHPFTLIKISDQACIDGHATHAEDYITSLDPASSLYDPTCNGQCCLPTPAPCDGTLDCCTGSCVNGTCVEHHRTRRHRIGVAFERGHRAPAGAAAFWRRPKAVRRVLRRIEEKAAGCG